MEDPASMHVIDHEIVRFDALEALRHALDFSYYRVRKTGRQQWERHFSDKFDPSDSCVAVRCAGFLTGAKDPSRKSFPDDDLVIDQRLPL